VAAVGLGWGTIGGFMLGLFLGYAAMMYMVRAVKLHPTPANFGGFVAVVLSGAVVAFLADRLGADSRIYGAYATGLGAGFILYLIMYIVGGPTRSPTILPFRS
jgi:ABC-type uncharacterized transport system permease subunit